MTLREAIEIKSRTGAEFLHTDPDEIDEADRLLIEAGKRCEYADRLTFKGMRNLLPGETEE